MPVLEQYHESHNKTRVNIFFKIKSPFALFVSQEVITESDKSITNSFAIFIPT